MVQQQLPRTLYFFVSVRVSEGKVSGKYRKGKFRLRVCVLEGQVSEGKVSRMGKCHGRASVRRASVIEPKELVIQYSLTPPQQSKDQIEQR